MSFGDLPVEITTAILSAESVGMLSHTILTMVCKDFKAICRTIVPKQELCQHALAGGHLNVIEWAVSIGCSAACITCESAANYGHLHIVKWARAHGCQLNAEVCANAAAVGSLETLIWARSQGCPWNYLTAANAAIHGQTDVLKWALYHGASYDSMLAWRGITFGYQKIAECVREYEQASAR